MELQFAYTNPAQAPFGINRFVQDEAAESESSSQVAGKGPGPQRQVRFKDQLELQAAPPMMFQFEQPAPLTINKGVSVPRPAKSGTTRSQKRPAKAGPKSKPKPHARSRPRLPASKTSQATATTRNQAPRGDWNSTTTAARYFDPSLEKKHRSDSARGAHAGPDKGVEISTEGYKTTGKIHNVGIDKTVEIYRDVGQLVSEETKPQRTSFLRKGKGSRLSEAPRAEKGKENHAAQSLSPVREVQVEEVPDPDKIRMRQEFAKKNEYVQSLKEELSNEKALRAQMDSEYQSKLNAVTNMLRDVARHPPVQPKHDTELDLVPSREVPGPQKKKLKGSPFRPVPPPKVVIKPPVQLQAPVLRGLRTKPLPAERKVQQAKRKRAQPPAGKRQPQPSRGVVPPQQLVTVFTEEMKRHEAERQVALDQKTNEALERLDRLAYHPNEELQQAAKGLTTFENKMRPAIEKVEQTIKDIERIERIKAKGSLVSMISNVSARYIVTYSDKITELLVDEMIEELAVEMNQIESQQKKDIVSTEQQNLALELLEDVEQLETEQQRMKVKWLRSADDTLNARQCQVEDIIPSATVPAAEGYRNPFEVAFGSGKPIATSQKAEESGAIVIYKPMRKELRLPLEMRKRINEYARNSKAYKTKVEGSMNADLWKVYDHITDDILAGILAESAAELGDTLEQYVEQMIHNEFGAAAA